jgi:CBS domain-containing protein
MKIKDIMSTQVEVLPPDATLRECAKKMKELDVGAIPVGENDRLRGIVTDRDIVVKAVAEGRDVEQARVRDAMNSPIDYCFEADDIRDAVGHMQEKKIRRIVVLNKDKRLVGMVSLGDVAAKGPSDELSGDTLEKVSQPTRGKAA